MKLKKHIFLCVIAFTIGLSACGTVEKEDAYSIRTPDQVLFSYNNAYENGLIYLDASTAYFLDYASFSGTPLCNKPNCTHTTNSCIAKIVTNFGMNSTPPVVYQDNIYYFTESDDIVQSTDGKETSYVIECQLHKMDISNGEQTLVCTFDGMEAIHSSGVYLDDGTLYFIALNGALQDDSGGWNYFSSGGIQYMCSIDLNSGTFTNYGQINDAEKSATTLFAIGTSTFGINGDVKIIGIYDGKIWMSYYYADTAEALYEIYEATGDFPDVSNAVWHTESVSFDLSSKEISTPSEPIAACIGEDYYIYWDSDKDQYIARNADGETALTGFPESDLLAIVNDLVFDVYDPSTCYDLSTNTIETIAEQYMEKGVSIIAYENQKYVIQYHDEKTNTTIFEDVPKSELMGV